MGASESTGRSNGTGNEEVERRRGSGGRGSTGSVAAIAVGAVAGAAVAAWGVSRMLSDNKNNKAMTIGQAPYVVETNGNELYPRVVYRPPFQGRFKMHTDGACRSSGGYVRTDPTTQKVIMRGPSGYGGILRDHRGKWVRGFYGFIGVSDCLTAEFHGILQGLLLLDKLCLKESVLESDSAAAIEWINHDEKINRRRTQIIKDCWSIIIDCKDLIKKNGITICSISRDTNKCADMLANMGIDRRESYMEIIHLPLEIKKIVDREASLV